MTNNSNIFRILFLGAAERCGEVGRDGHGGSVPTGWLPVRDKGAGRSDKQPYQGSRIAMRFCYTGLRKTRSIAVIVSRSGIGKAYDDFCCDGADEKSVSDSRV